MSHHHHHHHSRKQDQNPAPQFRPTFQTVYDGRLALGFVLARNKQGYEAFDINDHSLGIFDTASAAAAAIMRSAP